MTATEQPPQLRRINRGRGHSYEIDGHRAEGVTGLLSKGYPKQLADYGGKQAAFCAINEWDELARLPLAERLERIRHAHVRHRNEAGARGRAIHDLLMRLARGQEVDPPPELDGYVDAYETFVDDWQPKEVLIEVPVFSLEFGYGGTPDVLTHLNGRDELWLLDYKTGESGIWPDHALQMAAYRYADVYVDDDGQHPMPKIDRLGGVHIQDGSYEFREVEAGPDVFEVFGYVTKIAAFVAAGRDAWVGEALTPPPKEETE